MEGEGDNCTGGRDMFDFAGVGFGFINAAFHPLLFFGFLFYFIINCLGLPKGWVETFLNKFVRITNFHCKPANRKGKILKN